jgi:hypothetical protein
MSTYSNYCMLHPSCCAKCRLKKANGTGNEDGVGGQDKGIAVDLLMRLRSVASGDCGRVSGKRRRDCLKEEVVRYLTKRRMAMTTADQSDFQ